MKHIMVDLETLGVKPGSVIVSIGAVVFDPKTRQLGNTYYQVISLDSAMCEGLTVDPGTVQWWMSQSEPARAVFQDISALPLDIALVQFSCWVADQRGDDEFCLWGNGANFDNVLLRSAFQAVDIEPSWSPFEDRCYRTLKNLLPHVKLQRGGTHHNALDDACTQARHAIELLCAMEKITEGAW